MLNPKCEHCFRNQAQREERGQGLFNPAALPQVVREDSAISSMVESHKATPLDVVAQVRNTSFQTCEITG